LLPVEMLPNDFAEEEIDYGVQLTLFFLRHSPYRDGGQRGLPLRPNLARRISGANGFSP
jgi:hypothetical protein